MAFGPDTFSPRPLTTPDFFHKKRLLPIDFLHKKSRMRDTGGTIWNQNSISAKLWNQSESRHQNVGNRTRFGGGFVEIDIGMELGATDAASTQRLMLYLPNKDRLGNELPDIARWATEAQGLLAQIGGGATAFPPAEGTWIPPDGEPLWEQTRMIYSFILPDRFRELLRNLREFLHRFGRETNQGEVVVEFDGRFFRIREYDPPAGG